MSNVAFRGAHQVSTTANGNDATMTFDPTAPPRQGDIAFVFGGRANAGSAGGFGPNTSGYTQLASIDNTAIKFGLWYKVMGATPDTTVVVEGGGNAADGTAYLTYVVDGTTVDPAIFDATLVSTGLVTQVPNGPAITTVTPNARVIAHAAINAVDTSRGSVSGFTFIQGASANDTDDISIEAVYQDKATPGSLDPGAWSTWVSGTGGAFTIALKPLVVTRTASGSPVKTLSATASGTVKTKFHASGTPVKTLSATASGTVKTKFHASGSPTKTLSATADGDATMTPPSGPPPVSGSGTPVATLAATASGTVKTTFHASGAPVATLSATASGDVNTVLTFTGTGTPVATLSAFADGDVSLQFHVSASGAPVASLSAFATGTVLNPDGGAPPPRRKARGYFIVDEAEPEPEKKDEPQEVVEALPLPDVEPFPVVEPITRNPIPKIVVPKVSRRSSAPDPYDDEEEVLIQLLGII